MNQKLTLSADRKIAGVCGGLANYFGIDATIFRILYALLTIFTAFSGVILYFVLWAVIPKN